MLCDWYLTAVLILVNIIRLNLATSEFVDVYLRLIILLSHCVLAVQVLLVLLQGPTQALRDDEDQTYLGQVDKNDVCQIILVLLTVDAHRVVDDENTHANQNDDNHCHKEIQDVPSVSLHQGYLFGIQVFSLICYLIISVPLILSTSKSK